MAVTVPMPCASVVTERYQDALVGSASANGPTILPCALRQRDVHRAWGTTSTSGWRKEPSPVDLHARSTFHKPST
jgi:hypothetical protein